jgi:hypothetical protein
MIITGCWRITSPDYGTEKPGPYDKVVTLVKKKIVLDTTYFKKLYL